MSTSHRDVGEVLYTQEAIAARCCEIGKDIAREFSDKRPLVLITLSGATLFAADLLRCIAPVPLGLQYDFLRASSYAGASTTSSDTVTLQVRPQPLQVPWHLCTPVHPE